MDSKSLLDLFFFKEKEKDNKPVITTGAIVWGTLLRSFILMIIAFFAVKKYMLYDHIFLIIFIIWLFVAMPAYNAYKNFDKEMEEFQDTTLCGTCVHFEKSAQLCKIYDQHPTKEFVPCEGQSWEPKSYEDTL